MKRFSVLLIFCLLLIFPSQVYGDDLSDKQKQIDDLTAKVADLQSQAKTLAGQIAYYDGQIQLASLKISQSELLISDIGDKINLLEDTLLSRSVVLQRQIVQTYKQGATNFFNLFLTGGNFSDVISRYKYLQIIQVNNRRFLHDTQLVQSNYAGQKKLLEASKLKLEAQKQSLAALRTDKDNLLTQTKNNEATYQKQLQQAKLELQAIQAALALATKEGPVKAGDPIAVMGNSGYPSCSTGTHLHFEVRVNDSWVNAETYLKNKTDINGLSLGSGSWDWPLGGNVYVTQRYGKTPYSYVYSYSGSIHTGVDMVSDNPVVHAVADGTLYSYHGKCGSSDLNVKYIDHGNGLKTLYLHVQ